MKRRIGIYPGSFDPVHPGHIAFGLEAMRICELDEVIFLPEHVPRGKSGVTDMTHRVALLEHATAAMPALQVLTLETRQFTVRDTLPELRSVLNEADLTLLVGSDIVHTFAYRWNGLKILFGEVSLAIGIRSGDTPEEIVALMQGLIDDYSMPIHYSLVDTDYGHMSSTLVRQQRDVLEKVWPGTEIQMYIEKYGLYRKRQNA
jgi:nicotinate-nucleotide adenylyltransferase